MIGELTQISRDRILAESGDLMKMIDKDARIYLCGSSAVVQAGTVAIQGAYSRTHSDRSPEEIAAWYAYLSESRVAIEGFGIHSLVMEE